MNPWQSTFFGLKQIPRELTAFEIEVFFTFTASERQVIEQRRRAALKLGLALQIGFLRMSGRVLDAVRIVRSTIVKARQQYEVALAKSIHTAIDDERLAHWGKALVTPRESGLTLQSWLWAPPAKHSTRQIEELLERIGTLYELGIHRHFADV